MATLKKKKKLVVKTNYRLLQVKSIAECSNWSSLQYFRPSFTYYLSLRSLFCLFLSGRFRQVLPYYTTESLRASKDGGFFSFVEKHALKHYVLIELQMI